MGTMATATGSHGKKNNNKKHTIMDKEKKKGYESPTVDWTLVELESPICVASGEPAKLPEQKLNIEVEEYTGIENDVTFE